MDFVRAERVISMLYIHAQMKKEQAKGFESVMMARDGAGHEFVSCDALRYSPFPSMLLLKRRKRD